MAKFADVNRYSTINGVAEWIYQVKTTLFAAGWTIQASGDGLALYNGAGDVISTPNSGAGGMNNSLAWFRIQDPGTRREFIFQRGTGQLTWRVKYSALDKFTAGGAFNVLPTATDEQYLAGTAGPTYTSAIPTDDGEFYTHVIAQSTPEGDVYGFWMLATKNGDGAYAGGAMCEPLAVGSYPVLDADPVMLMWGTSATNPFSTSPSVTRKWYKMNLAGEAWMTASNPGFYYTPSSGTYSNPSINGSGSNPYNGDDDLLPIPFYRGAALAEPGFIGWARYIRWSTIALSNAGRTYPSTVDLATDAYVYTPGGQRMVIPWPDGIEPRL